MKSTLLAATIGYLAAIPIAVALSVNIAEQTPSLSNDLLRARITPPLITRPSGDLSITLLSPTRPCLPAGTVEISAEAKSSSKIHSMSISVDGNNVANSSTHSIKYLWNTGLTDRGVHLIRIYAGDADGNVGKIIKTVYN